MSRFVFSRKKFTIVFILVCAALFLLLQSPFSKDREFVIPMYSLTNIGLVDWNDTFRSSFYHPVNFTSEKISFVYMLADYHLDHEYVKDLQRYNNFLARTLSSEYAISEDGQNKTDFGCICGRVSDACICCGVLAPKPTDRSLLTSDLYKAVILVPHDGKTSEATLCLNITYLPQRRRIRTSAVLLHYNSSLYTKSLRGYKSLMNTTNSRTSIPVFNALHLHIQPLPIICAGNPALPVTLDICTHFVSLDYKVNSEFGPKTSFVGCAYVQIVMSRRFVVARFPQFCFQAYQGAVADADRAENLHVEKPNQSLDSASKQEPSLISSNSSSSKDVHTIVKIADEQLNPKEIVPPSDFNAHQVP